MFNIAGVLAAKRIRVPLLLEVNDASFIDRIRQLKFKWLAGRIEKYIFKKADAIITVSNYFKDQIVSSGVASEKIAVIPNAANTDLFSSSVSSKRVRRRFGLNGKVVIGYIGSMVSYQKVQYLLELTDEIVSHDKRAVLFLVGNDKKLAKEWHSFIEKRRDRVVIAGTVSHEMIPEYIAAMDIAILPHSNRHGSPMKIFEYMAMGKAIVAPRLPPLEEVLVHGTEALLIEPDDKNDLMKRIVQLLDDEGLRRTLGTNAAEKVKNVHNWTKNAERVISIYNELLGKPGDYKIARELKEE
jgi:glycosyltransferase involved in cell wall biosynthesis